MSSDVKLNKITNNGLNRTDHAQLYDTKSIEPIQHGFVGEKIGRY